MTASTREPAPVTTAASLELLDAQRLSERGRELAVPFGVRREGGRIIEVTRVLRHLPGKRITAAAHLDGRRVLAKLFIGTGSARHWARERDGLRALQQAGMPTPALLVAEALPDGGHVVVTAFVDAAVPLALRWHTLADRPAGDADAVATLAPAFHVLGRLHRAGLTHDDLHLDNFLERAGELLVIDGDAVKAHTHVPLDAPQAMRNLAMLIAQLPFAWDRALAPLLGAYRDGNPQAAFDAADLDNAIHEARAARLADYLAKARRDCTLFALEHTGRRMTVVMREHAAALAPLLSDPEAWLAAGMLFKDGGTATVARIEFGGRPLVIKRYNIKGSAHALSRALRPSRAWHSWIEGHRLRLLGIPTPTPLAVIESRAGPLRGRAWLITEHCAGVRLSEQFDAANAPVPQPREADALRTLFDTLHRARISHGDLKATNLFWDGARISLIDLDAMTQHRSRWAHARAWSRDRARLLRNWPADSPLHRWLDEHLPPGG
jgi:tRNA A-37 threonylcarbamoyl transferase component Bud32